VKLSLWLKLTGSFAVTVLLTAAALNLSVRLITENRYRLLVRDSDRAQAEALSPQFAEWYERQNGWRDVARLVEALSPVGGMMDDRRWMSMMGSSRMRWGMRDEWGMRDWDMGDDMGMMRMGESSASMFPRLILTDPQGTVLADSAGEAAGRKLERPVDAPTAVEVLSRTRVVGLLLVGSMIEPSLTQADRQFLGSVNTAMLAVTVAAVLISSVFGSLLFRHVVAPLRELSRASERIASGDLATRVKRGPQDEIGELAARFNAMTERLQDSRRREHQFIADAAHELRTPVTLLQGTLEMMIDGIYPPDRQRLEQLHGESQRLGRLVADMQDLSRADAGRLELSLSKVRIGEVLEEAAALFDTAARKNGIRLEVGGGVAEEATLDKDRIVRVLANLLANALRHTPSNGRIALRVEKMTQSPELVVCVEDTGPGIPPSDAERVFDRFYRADESRSRDSGGSGLGLSISREIIGAHGGRIWVDTSYRGGARLCFSIPRHPHPGRNG
jgi:signal transduction histidine kinase